MVRRGGKKEKDETREQPPPPALKRYFIEYNNSPLGYTTVLLNGDRPFDEVERVQASREEFKMHQRRGCPVYKARRDDRRLLEASDGEECWVVRVSQGPYYSRIPDPGTTENESAKAEENTRTDRRVQLARKVRGC